MEAELSANDIATWHCKHALVDLPGSRPILLAQHVTDASGTGIVHTAPAHGQDDFVVCQQHGIHPLCPVDASGHFCSDAPTQWAGKEALGDGIDAIIEALKDADMLIAEKDYVHSYPYDWRTKKPILTRATEQWFTDLSELQNQAVEALQDVEIIPEQGRQRLNHMVSTRKEVCFAYSILVVFAILIVHCSGAFHDSALGVFRSLSSMTVRLMNLCSILRP